MISSRKYGWLMFFGVGLLFKLIFLIGEQVITGLFYVTMVLGLFLVVSLVGRKNAGQIWSKYNPLLLLVFLMVLHTIIVPVSIDQIFYLAARISIFGLAISAVERYSNYYEKFFRVYLSRILLFLIFIGWQYGVDRGIGSERMTLGFNANDLGFFGTLGLVTHLFFNRSVKLKFEPLFTISIFLIVVLYSASKAALLLLILGLLGIYRLNLRSLTSLIVIGLALFYFLDIQELYIWKRLTSQTSLFETRDATFEAGIRTLQGKIWLGYGSHKYDWTDPAYWPSGSVAYGPHNAYLSLLIMYGSIIGGLWLAILAYFFFQAVRLLMKGGKGLDSYAALIVIIILFSGLSESVIVGVNEFATSLFWFSLVVLLNQLSNKVTEHD